MTDIIVCIKLQRSCGHFQLQESLGSQPFIARHNKEKYINLKKPHDTARVQILPYPFSIFNILPEQSISLDFCMLMIHKPVSSAQIFLLSFKLRYSSKGEGQGLDWKEKHAALLGIRRDAFLNLSGTFPAVGFIFVQLYIYILCNFFVFTIS